MSGEERPRHGITQPPPPLAYLVFLVIGVVVNLYYPIPLASSGIIVLLIPGIGIIAIALALGSLALRAMRRSSVSPLPWQLPPKLVVNGPFRFTRNPLYFTTTLMYVGFSVLLNTFWPIIFLIFPLVIMDRRVIPDERDS